MKYVPFTMNWRERKYSNTFLCIHFFPRIFFSHSIYSSKWNMRIEMMGWSHVIPNVLPKFTWDWVEMLELFHSKIWNEKCDRECILEAETNRTDGIELVRGSFSCLRSNEFWKKWSVLRIEKNDYMTSNFSIHIENVLRPWECQQFFFLRFDESSGIFGSNSANIAVRESLQS